MSDSQTKKPVITVFVDGGVVQGIYTTLTEDIEANVVDFDNARVTSDRAVARARKEMKTAQREQRMIY